jgi:hypothetical protein
MRVLISLILTTAVLVGAAHNGFGAQQGQQAQIPGKKRLRSRLAEWDVKATEKKALGRKESKILARLEAGGGEKRAANVDFMLPSTTMVRGPSTQLGPKSHEIGNAMCDLYPRSNVTFPYTSPLGELECAQALNHKACNDRCHEDRCVHDSTCTSYIWHPSTNGRKSQLFCDGSTPATPADWVAKCCLRKDGKYRVWTPMPGELDKKHAADAVVSGSYVKLKKIKEHEQHEYALPSLRKRVDHRP